MALNVKPLGDRILVEAVEEKETKKGGIIIPDSAKEKPTERKHRHRARHGQAQRRRKENSV